MSESATPWSIAHQASLSMGFSRQEYWNGWPFPFPGDLPDPGIEPMSPALAGGFFTAEPPVGPPQCWQTPAECLEVQAATSFPLGLENACVPTGCWGDANCQ